MFVVGTITALVAGVLVAQGSSAQLADLNFEIEGNLIIDDATKVDWASAAAGDDPEIVCEDDPDTDADDIINCGIDEPTGQGDNSFGNGTKEDTAVPSPVTGSIPNNKSDLTRFYVATNKEEVSGATKDMLYLAWERVQEPTGTTNMDFEFNQSATKSTNGVTPVRTAGDVLIKFDLSQGGVNPSFGIHTWMDGSTDFNEGCEAANRYPCWGPVTSISGTSTLARGAVNTSEELDPIAPDAGRMLSVRTFGEAAINLTDTGVLGDECTSFGSAYLKSRSSDSFTAALKDYIAPIPVSVTNCGSVRITKSFSSDDPSSPAVFTLYNDAPTVGEKTAVDTLYTRDAATKLSGATTTGATSIGVDDASELPAVPFYAKIGAEVVRVTAKATAPTPDTVTVTRAQFGTTAVAHPDDTPVAEVPTCSFTADGTCTIGNLPFGNYVVYEQLVPDGYTAAPPQFVSVGAAAPATATFTNNPAPVDIELAKRDGDGGPVAICTVTVTTGCATFKLFERGVSAALAAAVDEDDTTFTFASTEDLPESFTALVGDEVVTATKVAASTTDVTVVRATNGSLAAEHAEGAIVEVLTSPETCAPPGDTDEERAAAAAAGDCLFTSVVPGDYVIVETTHPAGRGRDADLPDSFTIALGDESPLEKTYDNPPLYKVVTVVCRMTDNTLYPSKLAYDEAIAEDATVVTPDADDLVGVGITDAEICGLTGEYVLDGAEAGTHTGNLDIP